MMTFDKNSIINDQMLTANISQLLIKISMFKKSIVENLLKENPNPNIKYNADDLMKIIREFISNWDDYGINMQQKMQTIDPKVGFDAIPYNDVKKFIYSNYDYKSISDFVDGLFKGIDNKELEDKDDIKSFFNYVTNLAFSGRGENPADLIQEVLENENMYIGLEPVNETEISYFNTIKKYNIFDRTNKDTLTKECENILRIIPSYVKDSSNFKNIAALFMNGLLSIMDFISYALVAFVTRVYIISRYINLYAEGSKVTTAEESEELMTESMDSMITSSLDFPYEELDFHDHKNWKNVKQMLREIIDAQFGHEKPPVDQTHDNIYDKLLNGTRLYKLIMSSYDENIDAVEFSNVIDKRPHELNELVFNLKDAFVASHQALGGSLTTKQALLATIKKVTVDNETAKNYKELLANLIFFSIRFMNNIVMKIDTVQYARESQYSLRGFNPSIINDFSTISKILDELYRDFGSAIYYKIKYIWKKINQLDGLDANHFVDNMKLNIPGLPTSDLSKDDTEMMGIPDKARGVSDLLIKMGAFNECENQLFHYEYLKSLPECDEYFAEAITWQTIFTQLKSIMDRMIKTSQRLLNSANFKLAIRWVNNNEAKLKEQCANFKGGMNALPYKQNIDVDAVIQIINRGLTNFENKYNNISKKEDVDAIVAEFNKLPEASATIQNINNDQSKNRFKNSLLFTNTGDQEVKEIPVQANNIRNHLDIWISTVKSAANVHQELINSINAISARQQKIVDMLNSKTTGSVATSTNTTQAAPDMSAGTNNQQPQASSTTGNQTNDNFKQQAITGVTSAVQQIMNDTYNYVTNAIFNQYNYIKEFNKLTTQTNIAQ